MDFALLVHLDSRLWFYLLWFGFTCGFMLVLSVVMGVISWRVKINSAVFTCACLFKLWNNTPTFVSQSHHVWGKTACFRKESGFVCVLIWSMFLRTAIAIWAGQVFCGETFTWDLLPTGELMFAVLRFKDIITCGFGFTCAKALLVGLRHHITIQVVHSYESGLLGFKWEVYLRFMNPIPQWPLLVK